MSYLYRALRPFWFAVPVGAVVFSLWISMASIRRIQAVTHTATPNRFSATVKGRGISESAHGEHELILPSRNEESLHWIIQTEQMFARREFRVRHVDYDNAPNGREVNTSSPYRWWLALLTRIYQVTSRRSIEFSSEVAALWANPALQVIGIIAVTIFTAWRLRVFAAVLISLGLASWFPFSAYYHPALPDSTGFANLSAIGGILLLIAGVYSFFTGKQRRTGHWFVLAGVVSGIGAWVSVWIAIPILIGTWAGALLAAVVARKANIKSPRGVSLLPWRNWALSGGCTIIAAYLVEYAPTHLARWDLEHIHPLHGIAWIGAGEILAIATEWLQQGELRNIRRKMIAALIGLLAIAALPITAHLTSGISFLHPGPNATRLSLIDDSVGARNFAAWILHDGTTATVIATTLPLLVTVPCFWIRRIEVSKRVMLAVALGPTLIAGACALRWPEWFGTFEAMLLAVVAAAGANPNDQEQKKTGISAGQKVTIQGRRPLRQYGVFPVVLFATVSVCTAFGAMQTVYQYKALSNNVTRTEAEEWFERDFARWLSAHTEGEVCLLAPPSTTTSLCFFGGFKGIGTLSEDNRAGIVASIRISTATSNEEARTLIEARGITHVVLPSWDPFFDQYIQSRFSRPDDAFISRIDKGNLPVWLRPMVYIGPKLPGFEGERIRVYAVVPDQKEVVAISRLAEYWLEVGDIEKADDAERALRRFPADVSALVARARVFLQRGEREDFNKVMDSLLSRVSQGGDRILPWDRRVSLAILLARTRHIDLSRAQLSRCFTEVNRSDLQQLSTTELYFLLGLGHALGLEISDSALRQFATQLLPSSSASR